MHRRPLAIVFSIVALALSACQRSGVVPPDPGVAAQDSALYPAFYLSLDGDVPFRTISFKDVSLQTMDSDPSSPVYEALAESLGYAIAASPTWGTSALVEHDVSLSDPGNHRFCGNRHLYVDVWRSEGPERLGYSLWSGCMEHDQFAWQELSLPWSENGDVVGLVEPLSQSIVDSVSAALESGCFKAAC